MKIWSLGKITRYNSVRIFLEKSCFSLHRVKIFVLYRYYFSMTHMWLFENPTAFPNRILLQYHHMPCLWVGLDALKVLKIKSPWRLYKRFGVMVTSYNDNVPSLCELQYILLVFVTQFFIPSIIITFYFQLTFTQIRHFLFYEYHCSHYYPTMFYKHKSEHI